VYVIRKKLKNNSNSNNYKKLKSRFAIAESFLDGTTILMIRKCITINQDAKTHNDIVLYISRFEFQKRRIESRIERRSHSLASGLGLSREGEILIKIFSTIKSGLRNPIGDLLG